MTRTTGSSLRARRHGRVVRQARGYWGRRRTTYRAAFQAVERAAATATQHRRRRKRDFRTLWIQRIHAACDLHGMKYSRFIYGLHKTGSVVNRKVLADLAVRHPEAFKALVKQATAALRQ